jgi:predicted transcriptional regulator of viral defense system
MAYLSVLIKKEGMSSFIDFAKAKVNSKYNLFEPGGEEQGEFIAEWKMRLSMDKQNIFEIIQNHTK